MVQLLNFIIPILLLCINTQAQQGETKKDITAALPEDLADVLNKAPVDVDYIPQKPGARISKEVLLNNPRLTFLGAYNGRNWYIERSLADQNTARSNCRNLGMQLARFSNQNELNFIYQRTVSTDDYAWTDGRNFRNPSGFIWDYSGSYIFSSALLTHDHTLGLVIDRYPTTRLAVRPASSRQYYLCFM